MAWHHYGCFSENFANIFWVAFIQNTPDQTCWRKFLSTDNPVDTWRKLNVLKTFRGRHGRLLKVLCTFNLRHVSTGGLNQTFILQKTAFEIYNLHLLKQFSQTVYWSFTPMPFLKLNITYTCRVYPSAFISRQPFNFKCLNLMLLLFTWSLLVTVRESTLWNDFLIDNSGILSAKPVYLTAIGILHHKCQI